MLGCNPHNPNQHIGSHDYPLLQKIIATINNDAQKKLQELQELPEKYQQLLETRVPIVNGRVSEIPAIKRRQDEKEGTKTPITATRVTLSVEKLISGQMLRIYD